MTSILMVCLGNICRSPLAEGILTSKLPKSKFLIDSAGTSAYHIGEKPDLRSIQIAKLHDISIENQRSRQFKIEDFDIFDYIYAMDYSNSENIINLARNEYDKKKVKLILSELNESDVTEVPDPYYGGIDDFESVYNLLDRACDVISNKLISI